MAQTNKLIVFVRKNFTPCRLLRGFMYSLFFMLACVSFYSTKTCTGIYFRMKGGVGATSVYIACCLLVYCLLPFLALSLMRRMHHPIKERIDSAIAFYGDFLVALLLNFLTTTTYPLICIYLDYLLQGAALWSCIGLLGSMFSLLTLYLNPEYNGLHDSFFGLCVGVLVNLKKKSFEQYLLLYITILSMFISRKLECRKTNTDVVKAPEIMNKNKD
ncbi:hypothetical protein ACP275_03G008500 [Erythranthe tilingii]